MLLDCGKRVWRFTRSDVGILDRLSFDEGDMNVLRVELVTQGDTTLKQTPAALVLIVFASVLSIDITRRLPNSH